MMTPSVGLSFVVACRCRSVAETRGLILDAGALVSQHRHVLTPVVGAEQQLPTYGQGCADVSLGATPVTAVRSGQLLGGGEGSSHVSPFRSSPEVEDLAQSLERTSNPIRTFPTDPLLRPEQKVTHSDDDHAGRDDGALREADLYPLRREER
jgi:hypothetical protein